MPLSASTLKTEIAAAFDERHETQSSDASINRLSEALANAIVDHIKNNLVVTVQGTGYAGTPVISSSENGAGSIS